MVEQAPDLSPKTPPPTPCLESRWDSETPRTESSTPDLESIASDDWDIADDVNSKCFLETIVSLLPETEKVILVVSPRHRQR